LSGTLIGLVVALLAAVALASPPAFLAIAIFSAAYFFCIGAVRGPDAGFFVGEALSALGVIGAAEAGAIPGEQRQDHRPSAWRSVWLLGIWLVVVVLVTWRG
jgi:hypothetical protein